MQGKRCITCHAELISRGCKLHNWACNRTRKIQTKRNCNAKNRHKKLNECPLHITNLLFYPATCCGEQKTAPHNPQILNRQTYSKNKLIVRITPDIAYCIAAQRHHNIWQHFCSSYAANIDNRKWRAITESSRQPIHHRYEFNTHLRPHCNFWLTLYPNK